MLSTARKSSEKIAKKRKDDAFQKHTHLLPLLSECLQHGIFKNQLIKGRINDDAQIHFMYLDAE